MFRKPVDREKLNRCVNKLISQLHLLDRKRQQWLLYDIDRYNWSKWDGQRRTGGIMENDEPDPQKYISDYIREISEEDRQRLLERITELNLTLDLNLVVCNKCACILESTYGHDFKVCPCGSGVFVDGGKEPGFSRMCLGSHGAKHFTTYEEAKKYKESIEEPIYQREVNSLLASLGIPQKFHNLFRNDYTVQTGRVILYCKDTAIKEIQTSIANGELKIQNNIVIEYTPRSSRNLILASKK